MIRLDRNQHRYLSIRPLFRCGLLTQCTFGATFLLMLASNCPEQCCPRTRLGAKRMPALSAVGASASPCARGCGIDGLLAHFSRVQRSLKAGRQFARSWACQTATKRHCFSLCQPQGPFSFFPSETATLLFFTPSIPCMHCGLLVGALYNC